MKFAIHIAYGCPDWKKTLSSGDIALVWGAAQRLSSLALRIVYQDQSQS